ncbi:lytic murein transglycosylase [Oleiphilus messinensis]|uniref:Lytic murein transglycosylase n=1 Tax=Oleiphilus messinensis TaxID=141451 RepID=A0A1Y0IDZ2_9GAMM|nr:transglycosylase SLT domain-containing protein [Oleiphilus messinensis]ARU58661.1 lytic murein transglycosylase [Oleiphilus messinensis]
MQYLKSISAFTFVTIGLGACSTFAGSDAPSQEEQQRVTTLYLNIENQLDNGRRALALIEEGQLAEGNELLTTAKTAIRNQIQTCAQIPSCELNRIMKQQNQLLDLQQTTIQAQLRLIESIEKTATYEDAPAAENTQSVAELDSTVEEMPASAEAPEENMEIPEPEALPWAGTHDAVELTEVMLRSGDFPLIIELNNPIKAALDDWLTWMRPNLMRSYENYLFLKSEIAPVYEKGNLPEALLFGMVATESSGKVHAYSRAGAAGLLQFMRFTGEKFGLTKVDGFDQRFDPKLATQANVAYLNEQLGLFHNSLEKALAAYNGGENRMMRLHKKFAGQQLWEPSLLYSLPKETREYVPKVLAAAWLFLHPERYRLEFPDFDASLAEIKLDRQSSLSELTLCYGQLQNPNGWFRALRNLNPAVKHDEKLAPGTTLRVPKTLADNYQDYCTNDNFLALADELHRANYPEKKEMIRYVVRRGDTTNRIASRYSCVSTRQLAEINDIRPPKYRIRVGQVLKVPEC